MNKILKEIGNWKKIKSKNPYITHRLVNFKRCEMIEVYFDIGFGKQRNATIYDLKIQRLSGLKVIKTHYGKNEDDALKFAVEYMVNKNE